MLRHGYQALFCLCLCVLMELVGASAPARSKHNQDTTLLVVPARQRMVQLAMDMLKIRPVVVLSYRGEARAKDPLLFVWAKGDWQYVSPDDFHERRFVADWPRQVVVIGEDKIVPGMLVEEAAFGSEVTRLKTLQVADLINALDLVFHFKDREWQWLSKQYDLNLFDINEPRRSYNPYDIPRSKAPLATKEFKQGDDDTPPAVLIESPAAETNALPKAASGKAAKTAAPANEPSLK